MSIKESVKQILTRALMRLPLGLLLAIKQDRQIVQKMDYPRQRILMHIDSRNELSRANSCKKEPGTVAWLENFLKKGEVLYDVGANTGPYSLIAAANGARVVAIEPQPQSYAKLCRNIVLNSMGEQVLPLSAALSDKTERSTFYYHSMGEGSSGHALGEAVDSSGAAFVPVGAHEVLAYRLDDLVGTFSLPAPHHIKIDVDGIELKVLAGAEATLASGSIRTVLVELEKGEAAAAEAIALLARHGFVLHDVREGRNHLFIRS